MSVHHIITKIGLFILLLSSILIFPQTAQAQEGFRLTNPNVAVKLNEDNSANITISFSITNNNSALIDEYELTVPFAQIEDPSVVLNGRSQNATHHSRGTAASIKTEFRSDPIRPSATSKIKFSFKASNSWVSSYGIRYFEFPMLAFTATAPTSFKISYPANFPDTSFVSQRQFTDQANTISAISNQGIYVSWGNQSRFRIDDEPALSEDTRLPAIVPIPVSRSEQQVDYLSFEGSDIVKDEHNNYWAMLSILDNFGYLANVTIGKFGEEQETDYHFDTAGVGSGILFSGTDRLDIVYSTFAFLRQNFYANAQPVNRVGEYSTLAEMWQELGSLSKFEMAYSAAVILQANGVPPTLKYGYIVAPNMKGFNTNQPHIWLEVFIDGQTQVFDPYLSIATEYEFISTMNVNRLVYGTYIPGSDQTLLGITSENSQRLRGTISQVTESADPGPLSIQINSPGTVSSGLYYDVGMTITNASSQPVPIKQILLNGENIAGSYLTVNESLERVLPPFGAIDFEIIYQREPNLLTDDTKEFIVKVVPDSTSIAEANADYLVKFQPNPLLLGVIFASVIGILLVLIGVLIYLVTGRWIYYFGKRTIKNLKTVSFRKKKLLRA